MQLSKQKDMPYTDLLPLPTDFKPTTDLFALLDALATRLGLLRKGGEKDLDVAREWLIKAFREGKIGRWTLDDLEGRSSTLAEVPAPDEVKVDTKSGIAAINSEGEDQSPASDLNAQVSATVGAFIARQMATLHAAEEGKDMSLAQQKKRENRAKSEEREAKWRAKGIPVGVNRRTARARGPGRPGFAKPRGKRR